MVPWFFLKGKQLGLLSEKLGYEGAKLKWTVSQPGKGGGAEGAEGMKWDGTEVPRGGALGASCSVFNFVRNEAIFTWSLND